jgi:hypothetical protein
MITSGVSHERAMSFLVWPTLTSSWNSGMARHATPWFVTRHASGEEAAGAAFILGNAEATVNGG